MQKPWRVPSSLRVLQAALRQGCSLGVATVSQKWDQASEVALEVAERHPQFPEAAKAWGNRDPAAEALRSEGQETSMP